MYDFMFETRGAKGERKIFTKFAKGRVSKVTSQEYLKIFSSIYETLEYRTQQLRSKSLYLHQLNVAIE